MNTGHDGSMGTLHANNPREALSRLESMITMGGFSLPSRTIREMICGSVDVVVQAARLRDGSRRITHITEVLGMEGDVIITQDLFVYDLMGEDANGNLDRPPSFDRHRPAALLGPRALLRRRTAAGRGARCRRSRRRTRQDLTESAMQTIALFFLVAVAIGGVAWVFLYPALSGERKAEKRQEMVIRPGTAIRARASRGAQKSRREQVEGTLKELEKRQSKSVPLSVRIQQAGLNWSTAAFLHHRAA